MKLRNKTKFAKFIIVFVSAFFVLYFLLSMFLQASHNMNLSITLKSGNEDYFQVYYIEAKEKLSEEQSEVANYKKAGSYEKLNFKLGADISSLRLDLGTKPGEVSIKHIAFGSFFHSYSFDLKNLSLKNSNQVDELKLNKSDELIAKVAGTDPYVELIPSSELKESIMQDNRAAKDLIAALIALITSIVLVLLLKIRRDIYDLVKELYAHKKMLYFLSVNDFKTKYAGSYLGVVWAFVQPVITVLIYWFVFEIGFRSGPVQDVPFVLWLIAGLVPWFFFAEAWGTATNCLIEYSYLVKKIVFQVRLLPLVKIMSSFFVHVFFVGLTFVIYLLYDIRPSIYAVQVIYYSLAAICFVFSISLITSSLIVFFKDLGQIISLLLQFGMWLTPILWSSTMLPASYRWLLKVNPAYYIVEGYRDSLIHKVWFWERYNQSIYFWLLTAVLFLIGIVIMKRTKPHFADVL